MLGKTYDGQYCSIARSLEIVGERWSLLILREALLAGITRFSDFQHNLGIATNVLTTRLEGFVASGLMERDERGDYRLTDKGRELHPVLLAFNEWGNRWHAPDGPPGVFTHAGCGEPVVMHARCETHGEVPQTEVEFEPGPGSPPEYLASRRPARSESS
jgi:DNA-binding HxlR family transcriptional regulator